MKASERASISFNLSKQNKGWKASLLTIAIATILSPVSVSQAATANLLNNGDAETHRCTDDWTGQTPIPNWKTIRGAASVMCYSAFNHTNETPVLPQNLQPGNAFLSAPGADTAIEQTVNVSYAAQAIDNGKATFTLSGWLGGSSQRSKGASLTAVFLDAKGNSTGVPVILNNSDDTARKGKTAFVNNKLTGAVPAKTRKILVTVNFRSDMTSFQNAFADNLSLVLDGPGCDDNASASADIQAEAASAIPNLDHIYVIYMENTNYMDVVNTANDGTTTINAKMPFLASLLPKGVLMTNFWGTYHPSDQNYVAAVAGDTFTYGPVYFPYNLTENHLGDLLDSAGKSWVAYVQNMITPCNLVTFPNDSWYSPDDEPFSQFTNVINNPKRCKATMRDLTDFTKAITTNSLPNFAWVAADGFDDGEGAWEENFDLNVSLATQDKFLKTTFKPLLNSASWKNSRSLLIISWDESLGWGWPTNHIPTLAIGSPGLLNEGTIVDTHYDGYSILKTIEKGFGLGGLGKFDRYANPMNELFKSQGVAPTSPDLMPAPSIATRGTIADTFGQTDVPSAVTVGKPIRLIGPANMAPDANVILLPYGQKPIASSPRYPFAPGNNTLTIATTNMAAGDYAAWLANGNNPPHRAPLPITILPKFQLKAGTPGVEILGAPSANTTPLTVREGANLIVHYCLPNASLASNSWIGVFEVGTPASEMTKDNPDLFYWLKTPGYGAGQACGEAQAFTSELKPNSSYQVILFVTSSTGTSTPVGESATINITPALPQ